MDLLAFFECIVANVPAEKLGHFDVALTSAAFRLEKGFNGEGQLALKCHAGHGVVGLEV